MAAQSNPVPNWSTSAFSSSADTSPMELSALGEHLGQCRAAPGRWPMLRRGAYSMHGFLSSRLVTTLVLAALLIGITSLAL